MDNHPRPRHVLNDKGVFLLLLLLAILSAVTLVVQEAASDPPVVEQADDSQTVQGAISWLLRGTRPTDPRHERTPLLASHIEREATYYSVDPYLLLATLFAESSLRLNQEGTIGEVGMGQLHGKARTDALEELRGRGIDSESLQGQVAQSAWLLQDCKGACGDVQQALSRYLTGRCRYDPVGKIGKKVRYRWSLAGKLRNIQ